MQIVHDRCCGLDVHKKSVVACVISPESQQTRTFGTTTRQLLALSDWLCDHHVTHIAMESTGVYWKPVYNLLEDTFSVYVVNARHIKTVPGRKTDVKDAEWIADLLKHGLLQPSFIPDRPQRELRELVRYRQSLVQEGSREANRLAKVLEGANIKLASVATDILGASGRLMLRALAAGEQDPQVLAQMAKGRLRDKLAALQEALSGVVGVAPAFPSGRAVAPSGSLGRRDRQARRRGGAARRAACRGGAGRGYDSRCWSSDGRSDRGGDGDGHGSLPDPGSLGVVVGRVSWQQPKCRQKQAQSDPQGQPRRCGRPWWKRRALRPAPRPTWGRNIAVWRAASGPTGRAMAVAHSIAVMLHTIIKTKQPFVDLGADYFAQRDKSAVVRRAVRQLERLGHKVSLEAA